MALVPRHLTPVADTTLGPMLVAALATRIGRTPVRALASGLLAQIWVENSRGNVVQNNIGSLSAGGFSHGVDTIRWQGDYWRPPWFDQAEIDATTDPTKRAKYQAQHAQMLAGEIPSAFKALPSIEAGLAAYLDLLFQPIYQPILLAAASGDLLGFAMEIHRHYNPDKSYDPLAVSRTFASLVHEFDLKGLFDMLPKVDPGPPAPSPSPSPSPWELSRSDVVVPNGKADLFRLSRGIKGGLVAVWQSLLNDRMLPVPALAVTAEFDLPTETLTKTYQAAHGLEDDGIVGRDTWSSVL